MLQSKSIKKLQDRIKICDRDIKNNENVEIRILQKKDSQDTLSKFNYIRRVVTSWERSNHKWFEGSVNDVYEYEDLVRYCNELQRDETPLNVILDGVFVAVGGSGVAPYDLREYLYLPSSLIEEDENIHQIHEAFKGFGEGDIVQL